VLVVKDDTEEAERGGDSVWFKKQRTVISYCQLNQAWARVRFYRRGRSCAPYLPRRPRSGRPLRLSRRSTIIAAS